MSNEILDYFGEFEQVYEQRSRVIAIKYFFYENEARIYAARLRDENIPCFISNVNSITAFPLGGGGIGLHVKESDAPRSFRLIAEMDANVQQAPSEEYYDATEEEINYLKALYGVRKPYATLLLCAVVLVVFLVGLRSFLRAFGFVVSWDMF